MEISLTPEMQQLIDEKVRSGQYASPEEVILAGLGSLIDNEDFGDFAEGALDTLIQEGERSIASGGTIPAEEVFSEIRRRSAQRRGLHRDETTEKESPKCPEE